VTSLPETAQAEFAKKLAAMLEEQGAAFDAASYRSAPPGLRIWCGATIEQSDLQSLTPWLDWAFAHCLDRLSTA
jgi:phosphoserine aminotransferase